MEVIDFGFFDFADGYSRRTNHGAAWVAIRADTRIFEKPSPQLSRDFD